MQSDFVYQYSITQNQFRYGQLISVNLRVGRIQIPIRYAFDSVTYPVLDPNS